MEQPEEDDKGSFKEIKNNGKEKILEKNTGPASTTIR
jgi:hypothetical protein